MQNRVFHTTSKRWAKKKRGQPAMIELPNSQRKSSLSKKSIFHPRATLQNKNKAPIFQKPSKGPAKLLKSKKHCKEWLRRKKHLVLQLTNPKDPSLEKTIIRWIPTL